MVLCIPRPCDGPKNDPDHSAVGYPGDGDGATQLALGNPRKCSDVRIVWSTWAAACNDFDRLDRATSDSRTVRTRQHLFAPLLLRHRVHPWNRARLRSCHLRSEPRSSSHRCPTRTEHEKKTLPL